MNEQSQGRPLHEPQHAGSASEMLKLKDHGPLLLSKRPWNTPLKGRLRVELRDAASRLTPKPGKVTVVHQIGTRHFDPPALALSGSKPELGDDVWILGEVSRRQGVTTEARWRSLWQRLGSEKTPWPLHAEIVRRWSEPHRVYHDLDHLLHCLLECDDVARLAEHPAEVELALWFHDAILDLGAEDNEQRSSDWARRALVEAGLTQEVAERVAHSVQVTKHEGAGADIHGDAAFVNDIDLSILGADPVDYEAYEWDVHAECAFVPPAVFRRGRIEILEHFMQRPRIYVNEAHFGRLERSARSNIARSLLHLRK